MVPMRYSLMPRYRKDGLPWDICPISKKILLFCQFFANPVVSYQYRSKKIQEGDKVTDMKMSQQEKLQEIEEPESVKSAEALESQDKAGKEDNQSVKLAMAEELVEMGIPESSAHRILNIRDKNI
jgi:hypothetical protein